VLQLEEGSYQGMPLGVPHRHEVEIGFSRCDSVSEPQGLKPVVSYPVDGIAEAMP